MCLIAAACGSGKKDKWKPSDTVEQAKLGKVVTAGWRAFVRSGFGQDH
jgi:hypothetical protein